MFNLIMNNNLIIGAKRLDLQDGDKYLISYPDDNSCSIAYRNPN